MVISYQNTKEETQKFLSYRHINSEEYKQQLKSERRMYYIVAGFAGVIGIYNLIRYIVDNTNTDNFSYALSFLMWAVIVLTLLPFYSWLRKVMTRHTIKRRINKEYDELPQMTITIDSQKMMWDYGGERGSVKLTEEILMEDVNDSYYLETRRNIFAIPKRVFESEQQQEEFLKLIHGQDRLEKTKALKKKKKKG